MDRLLTVQEIAEYLGVPESWVYEWTRRGLFPHRKVGKYLRFSLEEVEEWLEQEAQNRQAAATLGG